MRRAFRFLFPLLVLGGIAWGMTPVIGALMQRWFQGDAETRAQLVFNAIKDVVPSLVTSGDGGELDRLFRRIADDDQLRAVGFCRPDGNLAYASPQWPKGFSCPPYRLAEGFRREVFQSETFLVATFPPVAQGNVSGRVVILADPDFIAHRTAIADTYLWLILGLLAVVSAAVTASMAKLTLKGWVNALRDALKGDGGEGVTEGALAPELAPLVRDVRRIIDERERTGSDAIRVAWSPASLRRVLDDELPDTEVIVVSNREPYIHNFDDDGGIAVQRPASGLVTALEPITRACKGTWIAHGSGSADPFTVDGGDRLAVPPEAPAYTLRRVWLTQEEEDGYYYGLANEGLWPLCHIAFVRPVFRAGDWDHYVAVNRKFADAVVEEARSPDPVIMIQDYHLALLPRMIRERLPEATIMTFWHIPWPNPEMFSICPWRDEILLGLLGSSILGFHTRFHCNNFIETLDRFLECQIDREHSTIGACGNTTLVKPYPISIEWPPEALKGRSPVPDCRATVRRRLGLSDDHRLAVGVERFDYTKGIPDRFRAVESLLESHPEWVGRFTLVQVASPTRSRLASYREGQAEALAVAEAVNRRFGDELWRPIILAPRHHEPEEICELFRAADVCVVTSLHDGMNLVAKEFVASRDDEQGVLVLSTFAGASRELREALPINPYDVRGMGEAIHQALIMPPESQRDRMRLMREMVEQNNVYYWAGRMLLDAARLRKRGRIGGGYGDGKYGDALLTSRAN